MKSQSHDTPHRAVPASEQQTIDFWRRLKTEFQELHDEQLQHRGSDVLLHAFWNSKGFGCADGSLWDVSGGTDYILTQFKWLAERAAVRLGHPGGPNAVSSWLNHLKAESPHYVDGGQQRSQKQEFHVDPQGTAEIQDKVTHSKWGKIELLCKASAECCLKCETQERLESKGKPAPSVGSSQSNKLPPKKRDLSNYFDEARLTERQRECISLRLEYSMSEPKIARRLKVHHSVVQEHIRRAREKIDAARSREGAMKHLAKTNRTENKQPKIT